MTPACDACQLDFRPGEEADMETWERDGLARCHACAAEFAALCRLMDPVTAYLSLEGDAFWRALDDAMAHPFAAEMDARAALYPPPGDAPRILITATPPLTLHARSGFDG